MKVDFVLLFLYMQRTAITGCDFGYGIYTHIEADSVSIEYSLKGNHIVIAFFFFLSVTPFFPLSKLGSLSYKEIHKRPLRVLEKPLI